MVVFTLKRCTTVQFAASKRKVSSKISLPYIYTNELSMAT